MLDARERRGLSLPAGIVGDPLERNRAGFAHVGEQPHHRALVLGLSLLDDALDGQRVVELAHRLRVALFEGGASSVANGTDRRPSPPMTFRFYGASYINRTASVGARLRRTGRGVIFGMIAPKLITPGPRFGRHRSRAQIILHQAVAAFGFLSPRNSAT